MKANVKMETREFRHYYPIDSIEFMYKERYGCDVGDYEGFFVNLGTVNCGVDVTGKTLRHIYSNLQDSTKSFDLKPKDKDWKSKGILTYFSQFEFMPYSIINYIDF